MKDPILLASIVTILRFLYLKTGIHDCFYGTLYNGYTVLFILSLLMKIPIPLIGSILLGRFLYRKIVPLETYSDIYDPITMTFFFLGTYICFLLK